MAAATLVAVMSIFERAASSSASRCVSSASHRAALVGRGGLGHVEARLALGDGELAVEPVEEVPAQPQAHLPLVEEGVVVGPARVPAGVRRRA